MNRPLLSAFSVCGISIFLLLISVRAGAQESKPSGPQVVLLTKQVEELENLVAADLARRPDAAEGDRPKLDCQIDLHLIQRWLARRAAEAPLGDPVQVCATLRMSEFAAIGDELARRWSATPVTLSPTELAGLRHIHEASYKLPDIRSVADMDAACRKLADDLILAGGPAPGDVRTMPSMRPSLAPLASATTPEGAPILSLTELSARVKSINVSAPLKRELGNLAASAISTASEARRKPESDSLGQALRTALDLVDNLSKASGANALSRPRAEAAIAQALALVNDPRTRDAGFDHLSSLTQPGQLFGPAKSTELSPEIEQKLGPTMDWLSKNPEKGAPLMAVLRQFAAISAQVDGAKGIAGLTGNPARAVESIQKQIAAGRSEFLTDAGRLDPVKGLNRGLSRLRGQIDQLRTGLDVIVAIGRLNKSIQTLSTYKLRPYGMLERRGVSAINELTGAGQNERRDAAIHFILDTDHLAQIADVFSIASADVPPETRKLYMGEKSEAIETRRANLITELGSQLGMGRPLDKTQLTRLESFNALFASLRELSSVETALDRADVLTRWMDWTISGDSLRAALSPFREATIAAFDGFANDHATPLTQWGEIHDRYEPLVQEILAAAQYIDACSKLPEGYYADCAKLMAPMDNQPFAAERETSFAISLWSLAADAPDPAPAQAILYWLAGKLKETQLKALAGQ